MIVVRTNANNDNLGETAATTTFTDATLSVRRYGLVGDVSSGYSSTKAPLIASA